MQLNNPQDLEIKAVRLKLGWVSFVKHHPTNRDAAGSGGTEQLSIQDACVTLVGKVKPYGYWVCGAHIEFSGLIKIGQKCQICRQETIDDFQW